MDIATNNVHKNDVKDTLSVLHTAVGVHRNEMIVTRMFAGQKSEVAFEDLYSMQAPLMVHECIL